MRSLIVAACGLHLSLITHAPLAPPCGLCQPACLDAAVQCALFVHRAPGTHTECCPRRRVAELESLQRALLKEILPQQVGPAASTGSRVGVGSVEGSDDGGQRLCTRG